MNYRKTLLKNIFALKNDKNDENDIIERDEEKEKENDDEIKKEKKKKENSACVCRCDLCAFEHSPEYYLQPPYYREELEPGFQGNFDERKSKLKEMRIRRKMKMKMKESEEEILNDLNGCKNVGENNKEEEDMIWLNDKVKMWLWIK